jgi:hypothetical protein
VRQKDRYISAEFLRRASHNVYTIRQLILPVPLCLKAEYMRMLRLESGMNADVVS